MASSALGGPPAAPSTILVVDDNPVNLQVLVRTLHGTGHRILAARDAGSALEIVRRTGPDLVLLDIMMPGQDGFELYRAMQNEPAAADTMVIFLSALGETADKVHGLTLGAVDYITKPIQTEEVLARVSNHLAHQRLDREVRQHRDRLNKELDNAARMQRLLLPTTLPHPPGVHLAAHYKTSRHAGGDYYDVLDLGDSLGLFVADVSGHGAPAAIVMAMLRAVVHSLADPADPAAVLRHLNQHFEYLWDTSMFATAVYGVLDVDSRRLRLACAGHPPPLLYRPGMPVTSAPVDGVMPLLLMEFGEVPTTDVQLQRGDRLLFYTDGVTERLGPSEAMYDLERLSTAFQRLGSQSPGEIVGQLTADIEAFAAGQEAEDDLTIFVLGLS